MDAHGCPWMPPERCRYQTSKIENLRFRIDQKYNYSIPDLISSPNFSSLQASKARIASKPRTSKISDLASTEHRTSNYFIPIPPEKISPRSDFEAKLFYIASKPRSLKLPRRESRSEMNSMPIIPFDAE